MSVISIDQIQEEIIEEFKNLNGDLERVLFHIARLGLMLPVMPNEYKTDQNLVKGCHSKVWLSAAEESRKIYFSADSDTTISKGLVSLLLRILNGQHPDDILSTELYFIRASHLERFIGTKRSNGFSAMFDQMKFCVTNK